MYSLMARANSSPRATTVQRGNRGSCRNATAWLLLLLCILMLPSVAASAEFYVRPSGDCGANGDGTTSECAVSEGAAGAWQGFAEINWQTMGAGDELYLIGVFGETHFDVRTGGDENADFWVRGDHAGGDGSIVGKHIRFWEDDSDYVTLYGLTIQDGIVGARPMEAKYRGDLEFVAPNRVVRPAGSGSFIDDGFVAGMSLLTTSTASNQGTRLIKSVDAETLYIDDSPGNDSITNEPLDYAGIEGYWPVTHLTIDNSKLINSIVDTDSKDYLTVQNSEIDGQNNSFHGAIYPANQGHYRPYKSYVIRDNYIHDIGLNDPGAWDNHCIGIQGIHGLVIERNRLENCGAGIVFYHGSKKGIRDWRITHNYFKNMNGAASVNQFPGCGVVFSGACCPAAGTINTSGLVAHNVFDGSLNADPNKTWEGVAIRSKWEDLVKVYNNVIIGYNFGLMLGSSSTALDFKNNIVLDSSVRHITIPSDMSAEVAQDHNLFYPDGPTMFKLGGYTHDMATFSTRLGGINAHSLVTEPGLDEAYRAISPESPVVNGGVNLELREGYIASGDWPSGIGGGTLVLESDESAPDIGAWTFATAEISAPILRIKK